MIELVNRVLTPEERQLVVRHYFDGESQTQLAPQLGLDQQAVSRLLKQIGAKLVAAGAPAPKRFQAHAGRTRQLSDSAMWCL